MAVVAAAYRGLGIFGRLSEHTLERAAALGLAAVFGRAVTMHPYSQRAELAHGYREAAVCLAASPGPTAAEDGRATTRRALIISFLPLRRAARRVSLPGRYRERLLETYDALGLPTPEPAGEAASGQPSEVAAARTPETAAALLTIRGWDEGLAVRTTATIRMLLAEHVDVLYADVDLEAPPTPTARSSSCVARDSPTPACGSTAPETTTTSGSSA